MSTEASTLEDGVDTVAILIKQTDEAATPPILSSVEPAKDDDLDGLLDALSSVVISDKVVVKPIVPVRIRSWLEEVGFEQDKLDPIYLLAFLSRQHLRLRSNEIFKRELKDAIDKVQASRRPLLEAILDRVEVTDREVEDWELQGLDSIFTRDGYTLMFLLRQSELSILMIGETPRLSSALGVIGNRGSAVNIRATCRNEQAQRIRLAMVLHIDRCRNDEYRRRLTKVIHHDRENCDLFDEFLSSEEAQQFDATISSSYATLGGPYDIIFGHCLWPDLDGVTQHPGILLLRILQAVKRASDIRKDGRSTLVIFTIPDDDYWKPKYEMSDLISVMKDDYQYLGLNRVVEDQIQGYGYRHEKTKGRGKNPDDIYSLGYLAAGMLAYSFILRGKRNLGENEDIDP